MLADLFKGVVLGVIMWFALFSVSSAIIMILGEGFVGIALIFIDPVLSASFAWYYLKDGEISNKLSEGLRLGAVWILLSVILDLSIMAFILGKGFEYFLSWTLWAVYSEMIIFSTIVGYVLSTMKKRWLRE